MKPSKSDSAPPAFPSGASAANAALRSEQMRREGVAIDEFRRMYREGSPPWVIDRPQPEVVALVEIGVIRGRVLDVGCGAGDNAIYLASRGLEVVAFDGVPEAVARAETKARAAGVAGLTFRVADALVISSWTEIFDTILDSAIFHGFSDAQRPLYAAELHALLRPGGLLVLLCFSELETREGGPRRVTQKEIRDCFQRGWVVEEIRAARYHATIFPDGGRAWLGLIRRL